MAELSPTDRAAAMNRHHNDQWHARQAQQFREMSENEIFDRRTRRKYAANARRHERLGGR